MAVGELGALGRRWLGLHVVNHRTLTNRDVLACLSLADELGFSGATLNEDVGHDSFALLAVAADRTRRLTLGTAITNVYFRTPMQIAMGAVTIDDLSGGRAQLGLSVGHHPWNDLAHGIPMEAPLARLREYVGFIRKAVTGRRFTHEGRLFTGIDARLDQEPYRSDLPIFICGEGPRMLELAGEVADGVILNITRPEHLRADAVDRIRSAAQRAGRDPEAVEITSVVTCCVADNREDALRHARETFIERLRGSRTHLERGASPEAVEEMNYLRSLIAGGETERATEEASEGLVTGLIAAGTAQDVLSALARHYQAGCTRVAIAPYPRTREVVEHTLREIAAARVATTAR